MLFVSQLSLMKLPNNGRKDNEARVTLIQMSQLDQCKTILCGMKSFLFLLNHNAASFDQVVADKFFHTCLLVNSNLHIYCINL